MGSLRNFAASIAGAVLEAVAGGLTPRAALAVVQPPTFGQPGRQFPAWMLLGAAGWAGLLIGLFAAVGVSMLDGRIRQPEDAAEGTGTPVLARFAALVPWEQAEAQPLAGESGRELRSALDRLALLGSKVILVASAERGAGKPASRSPSPGPWPTGNHRWPWSTSIPAAPALHPLLGSVTQRLCAPSFNVTKLNSAGSSKSGIRRKTFDTITSHR